ncbi:carbonic anhydrase [Meira miltonrushii]|uniref:Carbonic anhydrase n=1 Tax=Meira miltonrushii TaxID=1280837 RepID=A0A316VM85_9BASI|nr:carbonic anhydrase [Meira miltonrushii]PWN37513.1 carbonic anhydrase [Meira miltonrushii]
MSNNSVTKLSPQEVLKRNGEWQQEAIQVDKDLFTANAAGQSPPILWVGCSDSRVPESVVCHVKPGDMFVHRNIANQFNEDDDSANSVLTYGVEALGVEHVIIVGHTSCGGVLASLSGAKGEILPESQSLQRYLTPLVKLCGSVRDSMGLQQGQDPKDDSTRDELLKRATEENVKEQVRKVADSKIIQANWAGKRTAFPGQPKAKIQIHGWIHDISNGKLRDLGVTIKAPGEK